MSKKLTKKARVRKATKSVRKFDKIMKDCSNEVMQDFKTYAEMINDFERNLEVFKYVCAVSVAAQNKQRKENTDRTEEELKRISELYNFHAVYMTTKDQIQSLRNHLSLAKKIRGNYEQLLNFITTQFVPLISEVQISIMNLYDLFRQYIPKNKEALEKMAETHPHVKSVLLAIEEFENKNFNQDEVVEPEVEENSSIVESLNNTPEAIVESLNNIPRIEESVTDNV